LVSALSVSAWAFVANAQNEPGHANLQNKQDMVAEAAAEAIVTREEAAAGRAFDPAFRAEALRKLASLTPSELQSIQSQSSAGLGIAPKDYGSSQADLAFTPVTPCRIIDTRVAGGPIASGTQRNFIAAGGSFTPQGGSNTDCGVPFGPATAVVVNLVAVSPAGQGDLRAFPFGATVPLASVLNYANVQDSRGNGSLNIANGILLKICDIAASHCASDFTVLAEFNSTDLVADVMGYFELLPSTLASGKTLKGQYVASGAASAAGQFFASPVSFQLPLSAIASAPNTNFIPSGAASTTNCPGTAANPQAAKGNFCVYEMGQSNRTFYCLLDSGANVCGQVGVSGSSLWFQSAAAGNLFSYGTWAVTAP
jgi:hypothetical protein